MEESKFINQQSLEVLRKQTNSTVNQRIDELETNIQNIFNYLQQQQEFLEKHQAYVDEELEKLNSKMETSEVVLANHLSNQRASLGFDLQKMREHILYAARLSVAALITAIGMGVALWLVK